MGDFFLKAKSLLGQEIGPGYLLCNGQNSMCARDTLDADSNTLNMV